MRTCGKCKTEIEDNREVCPKCGHLLWQTRHTVIAVAIGSFIIVLLFFMAVYTPSDSGSSAQTAAPSSNQTAQPPADPEAQKNEVYFQYAVQGAKALRDEMRNPDSFKLNQVILMPDGAACYTYRAQNGFGGMDAGYYVLPPDGQGRTNEDAGFSSAWKKECVKQGGGTDKTWEVGYAAGLHGLFDK
jgi:hypothetical protein